MVAATWHNLVILDLSLVSCSYIAELDLVRLENGWPNIEELRLPYLSKERINGLSPEDVDRVREEIGGMLS